MIGLKSTMHLESMWISIRKLSMYFAAKIHLGRNTRCARCSSDWRPLTNAFPRHRNLNNVCCVFRHSNKVENMSLKYKNIKCFVHNVYVRPKYACDKCSVMCDMIRAVLHREDIANILNKISMHFAQTDTLSSISMSTLVAHSFKVISLRDNILKK